jgi:hypothetical protein
MIDIASALKLRLKKFLQAYFYTTEEALVGSKRLIGDPSLVQYFDMVGLTKSKPKLGINLSTNNLVIYNSINKVDRTTGEVFLVNPLESTIPVGSLVKRTPGWMDITDIQIGDRDVITNVPSIYIIPVNMDRKWLALPTYTDETFHFKINMYVRDDGLESSTLLLMGATQELDDLLMCDLHLKVPTEPAGQPVYVYNSLPSSVDFGFIQKGTAILKASSITWSANEAFVKRIVSMYTNYSHFNYYPGDKF